MTVQCAECKGFYCRGGHTEASPDECPMRGDFPAYENLYREEEARHLLAQSARVESKGYCRWTRLQELREFSSLMGYRRIGLAHCPDMGREAGRVGWALREMGLDPILPSQDSAQDPITQSEFFSDRDTELNVLAGMCVSHEAIFLRATHAPTVSLIARDTRLHHNPAAGLYTSRSYLKSQLFGHWPWEDPVPYLGWDMETLRAMACDAGQEPPGTRPRIAEAMDVAYGIGARHVGVSFCVGFREEARVLTRLLTTNGFQVSSVCCKTGAVPKETLGLRDTEKVRPGSVEMTCNPLAQAELLNRDQVQFALVLGQCLGHDAATLRHLEAPAICLVAKDRVLAHNTVAALDRYWPVAALDRPWPESIDDP